MIALSLTVCAKPWIVRFRILWNTINKRKIPDRKVEDFYAPSFRRGWASEARPGVVFVKREEAEDHPRPVCALGTPS